MADEMIDVVDESGAVISTMTREETEHLNHLIQNVIIFIFTPEGKVWIQKRPMHKKHFPGLWDVSACGAVASDEKPDTAAKRETLEETGVKAKLAHTESFLNAFPGHDNQTFRRFSHLYIGISEEIPQTNEEVDEFKSVHHGKLAREIAKNPEQYVPSFLIELQKAVAAFNKLK